MKNEEEEEDVRFENLASIVDCLMFSAEELESWNELFPHCKIHESDLSNPSQAFLVKTLVAYIEMFGFKVEPPTQIVHANAGYSRDVRVFNVKLTHHIDKILKITDKSYAFTFYDLIRPTPKKTSHMLGILLNYLYYYNMYKTESIDMATRRLKERQESLDSIAKIEADYKAKKDYREKIEAKLAEYDIEMPRLEKLARALKARIVVETDELKMVQHSVDNLSASLEELHSVKRSLKPKVVSESEPKELQNQETNMKQALTEVVLTGTSIESYLKHGQEQVEILGELIKQIEGTETAVLPPYLVDKIKEARKTFKDAEAKIAAAQRIKQEMEQKVEKQSEVLRMFGDRHTRKRNDMKQQRVVQLSVVTDQMMEKRRCKKQLICDEANREKLRSLLEKEKEISKFLTEKCEALKIPNDIV